MKKTFAALIIAALALTGCASGKASAETGELTNLHETHITLDDGRNVTCIKYAAGKKGGLSCDWDGAR